MLKNIFLIPNYKDDIRNPLQKIYRLETENIFFAIFNFNDKLEFEIFNRIKTIKRPSIFYQYIFCKN